MKKCKWKFNTWDNRHTLVALLHPVPRPGRALWGFPSPTPSFVYAIFTRHTLTSSPPSRKWARDKRSSTLKDAARLPQSSTLVRYGKGLSLRQCKSLWWASFGMCSGLGFGGIRMFCVDTEVRDRLASW